MLIFALPYIHDWFSASEIAWMLLSSFPSCHWEKYTVRLLYEFLQIFLTFFVTAGTFWSTINKMTPVRQTKFLIISLAYFCCKNDMDIEIKNWYSHRNYSTTFLQLFCCILLLSKLIEGPRPSNFKVRFPSSSYSNDTANRNIFPQLP